VSNSAVFDQADVILCLQDSAPCPVSWIRPAGGTASVLAESAYHIDQDGDLTSQETHSLLNAFPPVRTSEMPSHRQAPSACPRRAVPDRSVVTGTASLAFYSPESGGAELASLRMYSSRRCL